MSAIVGVYYLDDRLVERENLGRMVDILAHRGSDKVGIWSEGPVGLGHRLLWTTPESLLEHFPLVNQTNDIILTADARIDNRDELIKALDFTNCPPEKITDSQLILSAYQKWGENCPEHLLGDFAFAIWDARKQTLFCARDHFGVRLFHYYYSDQIFVFATEVKAILCLPEVPRQLNEESVADYLKPVCDDATVTLYKDIFRLPPAHSMTVSHTGIELRCYWRLDPDRELRLGSDEEYAKAFRELFTEAVRCRLRSAFPVGSMLSGGMDSSSITCVAQQLLEQLGREPLQTFSSIFEQVTQSDEQSFINAVLTRYKNLQSHYVHGDRVSPLTYMDSMHWHMDEAITGGNMYVTWAVYNSAHEHNIRILLDGFDGDTTVSHGLGKFINLVNEGQWITLITEVRAYVEHFNLSPWVVIKYYVWNYGFLPKLQQLPQPVQKILKGVRQTVRWAKRALHSHNHPTDKPVWGTLNPNFLKRIELEKQKQNSQKLSQSRPRHERDIHCRRLAAACMPHILELFDKAAGRFSIEKRYPFWDKRLVEFCVSLPPEQKLQHGWIRMVMRRGMEGILPKEVQWRGGKGDLKYAFNNGLLMFEKERLEKLIVKDSAILEEYVDIVSLREVYQRFISHAATDDEILQMWRAVTLGLWLQHTHLTSPSLSFYQKGGEEQVKIIMP